MKSLSVKLSVLFLIFVILLESILFFFLYVGIVSEQIYTETEDLKVRGRSHSNVLEKNFDAVTIKHVALMETEAATVIVVTDENNSIIENSNPVVNSMQQIIDNNQKEFPHPEGEIVEARWRSEPYLATLSPIESNGEVLGYIYMFLPTDIIRSRVQNLTSQFMLGGLFAVILTMITVVFLSHSITQPLIRMKEATKKMSTGFHHIELDIERDDELGDLSRSIQKLSDDLERIKKDRNKFLSDISHELRTPLTYIKGYADILKRPNLTDSQHAEYVTILQEESIRVTTLVTDLFDLAKMDQNEFLIKKEKIELCTFLHEVAAKFRGIAKEKNVTLNVRCDHQIILFVDPQRFSQVLINLLDNAFKHSQGTSTVNVDVIKTGDEVEIYVSDEGQGIPSEELPLIWDRLYRVDKSRSRSTGGSGLGLTIAKEIVEQHGGTIRVESKLGIGTTFIISLKGVK
ncbi:sensor histidine kinase [Bacillus solimangrovi]|uniref:histidine kinase n=1 Tax=Bacillus solimangrovi TaxID=1305675 RepID=A0A1E5LFC0_9BACI|nr:HAMP domain-containing sensor histidine kinase [Bacillus solimangrovi]OEH92763.1 two-component sensor histidine kinase [Bacillus solimangrovi]